MANTLIRSSSSYEVDTKKVSHLCQESLDKKWHEKSEKRLNALCPFCDDVWHPVTVICSLCLCPWEICGFGGGTGYLSTLTAKYNKRTKICDLMKKDLDHIRSLFQKYIIQE